MFGDGGETAHARGWHKWMLTTQRLEEGTSRMGQFNAGMGLD
jgi:hypothetical protein